MLELKALTKRFGARTAVAATDLKIARGEMVGIIGKSGAGKSTLLRMINRLTEPSGGSIIWDGTDVTRLTGAAKRRWQRDCAMIFQQFNLVPRLDVVTNVMLGRLNGHGTFKSIFNIFGKDDIRDAVAALDRLGIASEATKRAEALSGGQQQRVAIARALMQEPQIILADEPIASLDPLNAEIVMKALREIHQRDGRTVICNLHTLDTARTYCDRVIGMRDGLVVFDGSSGALTREAAMEIYGAGDEFNEAATSTSITRTYETVASPLEARAAAE
ncbi:MAG: phosphonate ABC transporter ATP-binding protein [Rhizobiales bacterium]|nr:phosphonate ABC transporter ATP-binding protein [Hyphomicrobiales bacterium]